MIRFILGLTAAFISLIYFKRNTKQQRKHVVHIIFVFALEGVLHVYMINILAYHHINKLI